MDPIFIATSKMKIFEKFLVSSEELDVTLFFSALVKNHMYAAFKNTHFCGRCSESMIQ